MAMGFQWPWVRLERLWAKPKLWLLMQVQGQGQALWRKLSATSSGTKMPQWSTVAWRGDPRGPWGLGLK